MHGRRILLFAMRADLLLLERLADPDGRWRYVSQEYQWAEERPRLACSDCSADTVCREGLSVRPPG